MPEFLARADRYCKSTSPLVRECDEFSVECGLQSAFRVSWHCPSLVELQPEARGQGSPGMQATRVFLPGLRGGRLGWKMGLERETDRICKQDKDINLDW